MKILKTENCVVCGNKAIAWHGYVIAKDKMALGNYIDVKVISGYCKEHEEHLRSTKEEIVQGKSYNSKLMEKCIPLFL